jgi:hypothetical protein
VYLCRLVALGRRAADPGSVRVNGTEVAANSVEVEFRVEFRSLPQVVIFSVPARGGGGGRHMHAVTQ